MKRGWSRPCHPLSRVAFPPGDMPRGGLGTSRGALRTSWGAQGCPVMRPAPLHGVRPFPGAQGCPPYPVVPPAMTQTPNPSLPSGSQDEGKVIHITRVQHRAVQVGLGEPVTLPCLFLLHPSSSSPPGPTEPAEPPRIKWSKVRSAGGQREDVPILVAKDNAVKVVKGYEGRVSLPGYPRDRSNASLQLRAARASDAGLYRCQVVAGIDDEQDLLPLEVTGERGRVGVRAGGGAGGVMQVLAGW